MLRKKGVVEKFVEFYGPGLVGDEPRRPRHDRQHGPRVRRHLRLLPGRRRDARLPAPDRPQPGRGGPRRALLARSRACSAPRQTPDPVFTDTPRARPRDGRAEPGRAEAAARPRGASRHEGVLPQGAHRAGEGARLRPRPRRRPAKSVSLRDARAEGRAAARLGRDRRDHELHQHLEPVGDAGRGAPRPEGRPPRPARAAPRQDEPGAGLEGGDRVPPPVGSAAGPRGPRLPRRGLRLHDLHRQQRTAARPRCRRRWATASSWPRPSSPATATSRAA